MRRLTAADLRARAQWDVEIDDGLTVRMRRIDLTSAYMQGLLPSPLMAALGRLIRYGQRLSGDASFIEQVPSEDKALTLELMRRYACAAIIDPVFVMDDADPDPNHCPVAMLTSDQLVKIWQSGPPNANPATVQEVRADQADSFRTGSTEAPAAVPDGAQVPSAAVGVSHESPIAAVTVH